jgi:hypothetical protein
MADIPDIVYAGDSLEWTEGVGDYPAPTWTMHYVLRGVSILDLTSTPSGSDHAFTATATQTANLAPGRYSWQSFVSGGTGERYTIATGTLTIRANLAVQTAGFDGRSHAQKVLDAIEASMEGRATKSQAIMRINNREIQYLKPEELIKWRSFYKAEVARERTAEKVAQGEDPGNRILTRFRDDASRGPWPLNRVWRWPW